MYEIKNDIKNREALALPMLDGGMSAINRYPSGFTIEIQIFDEITNIGSYTEELQAIQSATENDTILLKISSYGGNVDTAVALLNALSMTRANVVAELLGVCCSCATWFFLCANSWIIHDDIEFMIHNYSTGFYGKGGDISKYVEFTDKRINKMMAKYYEGFLTEDELASVRNGGDIYCDTESLGERVKALAAYREQKQSESLSTYFTMTEDFLSSVVEESKTKADVIPLLKKRVEELSQNEDQSI